MSYLSDCPPYLAARFFESFRSSVATHHFADVVRVRSAAVGVRRPLAYRGSAANLHAKVVFLFAAICNNERDHGTHNNVHNEILYQKIAVGYVIFFVKPLLIFIKIKMRF